MIVKPYSDDLKLLVVTRKSRANSNFSIESIFGNLVLYFQRDAFFVKHLISPCLSNGFLPRLYSGVVLFFQSVKFSPDIVHITGDVHFLILFVPFRLKILTVHDTMLLGGLKGFKRFLYKLFWFDLPFISAAKITTVSDSTRLNLLKEFPYISTKLVKLYPIIDHRFKRSDKTFNDACPEILLIGSSKNKNLNRVFESTLGLNIHLTVVASIDKKLESQLSGQSYDWFDNLSLDDLILQYNACDIVCVCSMDEGFGLPIIEAQVVGRPVLTSNRSSMPEVAGLGALFIDPYEVSEIRNGIQRLILDAELRAEIVEAGFLNSKRFCHEKISKEYVCLYNETLANC